MYTFALRVDIYKQSLGYRQQDGMWLLSFAAKTYQGSELHMCVIQEILRFCECSLPSITFPDRRMRHCHASCSCASCRAVVAELSYRPWISPVLPEIRNVDIKEVSEEAPAGQGCLEGAQLEEWLRCSVPGNQGQLTRMRLRKL